MEYHGIRYTIRAGIERGQWCVAIHPDRGGLPDKKIVGTREEAQATARSMINYWLTKAKSKD